MAEEAAWVLVQKKTFTKWMNSHLKKVGTSIDNCQVEFDNGIKLMQLIKALYGLEVPKHNPAPKMRPQQLDNITLALDMVEKAKVKTNFLKSTHLADHDLKMILGMIWAIILDYQIKGISVEELSAKEALLLWCQKKTKGYRDVKVDNFSGSWRDGMALCALIHKHRPDLIDFDSLEKGNHKQNLQYAFDVAEKHLGISPLLDVEDVDVERPDERSVMTYISEFYHKFTSQDHKENAARRVQKFARFHQGIEESQAHYSQGAKDLLNFANGQKEAFEERNFPDDFGAVKQLIADLKQYKLNQKPQQNERKLDNESVHNAVQTRLRTNKRKPWDTPQEVHLETVDVAFAALAEAEKQRGRALRDKLAQIKEDLNKKYAERADALFAWLQTIKVATNNQDGEPVDQLRTLNDKSEELNSVGERLGQVEQVHRTLESNGLEDDNPYTDLTYDELVTLADQVKNALNKRKQFLESQLSAGDKEGLTPEQINDLREAFNHFDKDGSGALDKLELKSCLTILGLAYGDDAISNVFTQLSAGKDKVEFEPFLEYMTQQMEDTDDANQIKSSFKILSNEQPHIKTADLYVSPLEQSDVTFLTERMPGESDNFDFATFTDDKFA